MMTAYLQLREFWEDKEIQAQFKALVDSGFYDDIKVRGVKTRPSVHDPERLAIEISLKSLTLLHTVHDNGQRQVVDFTVLDERTDKTKLDRGVKLINHNRDHAFSYIAALDNPLRQAFVVNHLSYDITNHLNRLRKLLEKLVSELPDEPEEPEEVYDLESAK